MIPSISLLPSQAMLKPLPAGECDAKNPLARDAAFLLSLLVVTSKEQLDRNSGNQLGQ